MKNIKNYFLLSFMVFSLSLLGTEMVNAQKAQLKKADASTKVSKDTKEASMSFADEMKPAIQQLGKLWGKAIQSKDASVIKMIYDQNAHYLPNNSPAIHGIDKIMASWEEAMAFMLGLELNMETLEGTKDLLYETGTGIAIFLNEKGEKTEIKIKYVNVWKVQEDGSYKVVIDTYNEID